MLRTLLGCIALILIAPTARAEPTITPTETLIRLTVSPMPAPKPALRYLLLPELKEMNPGNPIPNYLKCLLEQNVTAERETVSRSALRQADWAARLDKPDWQILLKVKTDGFGLLLPDVQKVRALAAGLKERFREEVAQQRFDDALVTAKTLFAMSRHLSEHPTLIGDLVGFAIANVAIVPLEEMLEQPGCPNLYWALMNLPNPLVPMQRGLEGERILMIGELHDLDDTAPMSAAQLKKSIARIDKLRALDDKSRKPGDDTRAWLDVQTRDEKSVAAVRRRLVDYGLPADRVAGFPADQAILLDMRREYEVRRDELMKLMNLPAWQFEALAKEIKPAAAPLPFEISLPGLLRVRRAQARLEQRLALLRHVEALRLYAADHGGELPKTLADITVPLPADPFTGKPFSYTLDGSTAHLRGSPPPGEEKNPGFNVHYEVSVKK